MLIEFEYGLHSSKEHNWDYFSELLADNSIDIDNLPQDVQTNLLYTFYEVILDGVLDTETGKVTLVKASL